VAHRFQSLRFPLEVDRELGRIRTEPDYDAYVVQLIRQVLLTSPGERVHRPDFGAGLRRLVFAPNSPAVASLAETMVAEALDTWLGTLIQVDGVRARANVETLEVTVAYSVLAHGGARTLRLEVPAA
jgi:hypothetical protein